MKIRVVLMQSGRIFAEPDPVRVLVGEPIAWEFVAEMRNQAQISWLVYFQNKSPFSRRASFQGSTRNIAANSNELFPPQTVGLIASATHIATTKQVIALQPGDYKYGVRATAFHGRLLGDDDPILIVIP